MQICHHLASQPKLGPTVDLACELVQACRFAFSRGRSGISSISGRGLKDNSSAKRLVIRTTDGWIRCPFRRAPPAREGMLADFQSMSPCSARSRRQFRGMPERSSYQHEKRRCSDSKMEHPIEWCRYVSTRKLPSHSCARRSHPSKRATAAFLQLRSERGIGNLLRNWQFRFPVPQPPSISQDFIRSLESGLPRFSWFSRVPTVTPTRRCQRRAQSPRSSGRFRFSSS